ncbi:MAG: TIGR00701 family protein [Saprospiraceae bacterium]|nr:TIGR00701 family protein [Saprospiraceae bacterium]
MLNLLYISKALHVVGFVAWFAGLFYLVRMFVYYVEASEKTSPEREILQRQFLLMQWRVYKIICNPAMMITWTAGLLMLGLGLFKAHPSITNYLSIESGTPGWMHLKLLLLFLLFGYHIWCKRIIQQLETQTNHFSAFQFRLFNEIPSIFLIAISFIAVFGRLGQLNYWYLLAGVGLFTFLIYRGALAYKRRREQQEKIAQAITN